MGVDAVWVIYLDSQGVGHQELILCRCPSSRFRANSGADIDMSAFDMVVSLGGDGTILRAARLVVVMRA